MVRIQLHLTDQQARRLAVLARRRGCSRAELIRLGIDRLLAEPQAGADPLLELVGAAGPARATALSEDHDRVLYGAPEAEPPPKASDGPDR